ncbi:Retrovirus-related Pol polyprotein from transposon 17.6 [Fagus crenata]
MLKLKAALSRSDKTASRFTLRDDLLWFQNRLVLPASSQFKTHLIREFHDTPVGGHSGVLRTYKRIAASFYWAGMKCDIHDYIRSRIHPVFHVLQLKQKLGAMDFVVDELPAITEDGAMVVEPKWILEVRWTRVGRKTVQEVLVHWTGLRREDATWERLSDLEMQFPHLNLEDKIRLQGEGNVMTVATKKNEEVDGHARCADVADSVHEANENTLKSCG